MNEKEMNAFEDEEIVEMYKANVQTASPDMGKLWSRIEAAVDAQEKNDETQNRQRIKSSGRARIMRTAVTAAALAVVAYAGFAVYNSRIAKDESNGSDGQAYSAPVSEDQNKAENNMNNSPVSSLKGENKAEAADPQENAPAIEQSNTAENKQDTDGITSIGKSTRAASSDTFLLGKTGSIVFVNCKEIKNSSVRGWFVDRKGDVYSFDSITVSEDENIYTVLEALIGKQSPVTSVGEETASRIVEIASDEKDALIKSSSLYAGMYGSRAAVRNGEVSEELAKIVAEIEEAL